MHPLWIKIFSSFFEMDVERYFAQEDRDYTPTMLPLPPAFLSLSPPSAARVFESARCATTGRATANIGRAANNGGSSRSGTHSETSPHPSGHGRGLERVRESGSKRYKIISL
jgi:hypothetical protein